MNVSSSSSSTNSALDALLAAQARQASAATRSASYATTAADADPASPLDANAGSSAPAAPSSFDVQRSTSDFAGSRGGVGGHHGGGHRGNPAALLDAGTTDGTDSDSASTTPDAMQTQIAQGYLDLMGSDFGATGTLSLSA